MKKVLLGTTALIAGGLAAVPAMAADPIKVGVGGYMQQYFNAGHYGGTGTGAGAVDYRTTVWVTANPYADALTQLRNLLRYPNGCLEQTSSMTRPLLFGASLSAPLSSRTSVMSTVRGYASVGFPSM